MQELSAMTGLVSGAGGKSPNSFSLENGKIFQKLVESESASQSNVLTTLVQKAEDAHQQSRADVTKEMRKFDRSDELVRLIEASHVSAMHSVELQLSGKVGGKLSESFEQIYKQQ